MSPRAVAWYDYEVAEALGVSWAAQPLERPIWPYRLWLRWMARRDALR